MKEQQNVTSVTHPCMLIAVTFARGTNTNRSRTHDAWRSNTKSQQTFRDAYYKFHRKLPLRPPTQTQTSLVFPTWKKHNRSALVRTRLGGVWGRFRIGECAWHWLNFSKSTRFQRILAKHYKVWMPKVRTLLISKKTQNTLIFKWHKSRNKQLQQREHPRLWEIMV